MSAITAAGLAGVIRLVEAERAIAEAVAVWEIRVARVWEIGQAEMARAIEPEALVVERIA